ncbi:hypothetical protein Tco_1098824 [Tanacetum coccineum]
MHTTHDPCRDLSRIHSRPQPRPGSKEETLFNSQARLESEVYTQLAYMILLRVDGCTIEKTHQHSIALSIPSFRGVSPRSYRIFKALLNALSVSVGHWLSPLLKAPDVEVGRGHKGSSKIRVEAFITLRVLVAKVGTADQVAFFLPGVVSQIGKLTCQK